MGRARRARAGYRDRIPRRNFAEPRTPTLVDDPAAAPERATDPKAYALHLQAVQLARKRSAEGFAQSDALYRDALAIDPGYAPAWVNLATNLVNEVFLGLSSADEAFPRAREAANRALELDPDSAHAHGALGSIAVAEGNLAEAATHFERAVQLDPASPTVLGNSSMLLKSVGRLDKSVAANDGGSLRILVDSLFRNVRSDPRWVPLLRRLGKAPEQVDAIEFEVALP